jgi:tRNA(fMet)-specific endonuclease VapC
MAVILDTDSLTILQKQYQPACGRLEQRLQSLPQGEICTTIITFQEQAKGWIAYVHQAKTASQIVHAYAELLSMLDDFRRLRVFPFDQAAQAKFEELRRGKIRVGTLDLRIAAISLTSGAKLLSRNLRDFRQVPGLDVEDWTV